MVRSLLVSRVARMAVAPVGAVATVTTTSLLLGEHASLKASSRFASKSMETATRFLLQRRSLATSTDPTKKIAAETATAATKRNIVEAAAPAAPETVVASGVVAPKNSGFVQWYEHHLHERPVQTKMVTGSLLWSLGDCVAQVVPYMASKDPNKPAFHYDLPRTGRAAFFGFAIHAPASHVHFNFLEWMTVKSGLTGLSIPVFKTIMEQFVYWSWISNSMYHGAMELMQGHSVTQAVTKIELVLWDTQKAQWAFWIPIQLLNFNFIPVRHQLNVVLLTSIVWTALLSAWYPPQAEGGSQPEVEGKGDDKKIETA